MKLSLQVMLLSSLLCLILVGSFACTTFRSEIASMQAETGESVTVTPSNAVTILRKIASRNPHAVMVLAGTAAISFCMIFFIGFVVSKNVAGPAAHLSAAMSLAAKGDLNQSLNAGGSSELRGLQISFLNMLAGLKKWMSVQEAFGGHVSMRTLEKILKDPGRIGSVSGRKNVTVLFADIRKFTAFAQANTPEEVIKTLNQFYAKMTEVIFKYEGMADKFMGDSVMAVFGTPLDQPDHAWRAMQCALDMQRSIAEFNKLLTLADKKPIQIGIGVNSGTAVSGRLGAEKRMEYSVAGDAVNMASLIENLASEGEIVIGPETYEQVKEMVEARALSPRTLKGRAEEVVLYVVAGMKG